MLTDLLTHYGATGMFAAAFLAGSFFPFSSEAVLLALLAAGAPPEALLLSATAGNTLGSLFNYWVGRMGKTEWIEKYLHVKKKDLDKARRFMAGKGAWSGLFTFLPILGSAIAILLGLMRANFPIVVVSITISKLFRYVLLVYGASLII